MGEIIQVSISDKKGERKRAVDIAELIPQLGIKGDAHAGDGHRQISLLAIESIDKMRSKGLDVGPGDFAENITTQGIDLLALHIGDQVIIGEDIILEITQLGKECHDRCAIYYQAGDCVMPREGVFAAVIKGGQLEAGHNVFRKENPAGLNRVARRET